MRTPHDQDHPDVFMLPPLILLILIAVAVALEFTGTLRWAPTK